jgi:cytochrome c biogenesis protein CcmG, thiol:disulfide interchange protein DsbE
MAMADADSVAGRTPGADRNVSSALSIAFVILAMLFGFAVLPRLFRPPQAKMVGQDAPAFALPVVANAIDGKERLGLQDLRGKPVLLDFWATWCGPCNAEAPVLNKLAQRYRDRIVVVGVNTSEGPGRAGPWAMSRGITFPIVFDDEEVAQTYGVENLPTLVLVSREGKVLAVRTGVTSDSELDRLVTGAL